MHMTADEVAVRLQYFYLDCEKRSIPAIRKYLDECMEIIRKHIVADMRQDELALDRMTDDDCPLVGSQ